MRESLLNKFVKLWSMGTYELNILSNRCYPSFVFDSSITILGDEIPVFLFHSVKSDDLEEKLAYLVENGYQTITADELYDFLTGRRKNPRNKVLLTFDDGCGSLWTIAYPLLKKYGLVGVAFIVPNWIKDRDGYYPNLADYWNGAASRKEMEDRESSRYPFITWQEVKEMHESGIVDFQSHTLNHSMVFTSDVIVDFINPGFNFGFYYNLVPLFHESGNGNQKGNPEMGAPVYTMAPSTSGARRYLDDGGLKDVCISMVRENGGMDFFNRRNWRKRLKGVVDNYRECNVLNDRYESDAEREEMILYELRESKAIIERYLPGKSVNHLCYPFFAGSELCIELSKKSGYLGNFWGWDVFPRKRSNRHIKDPYLVGYQADFLGWEILRGRQTNKPADDPYRIVRSPGDYILRLPGKGRRSIPQILARKCLRNLGNLKKRRS